MVSSDWFLKADFTVYWPYTQCYPVVTLVLTYLSVNSSPIFRKTSFSEIRTLRPNLKSCKDESERVLQLVDWCYTQRCLWCYMQGGIQTENVPEYLPRNRTEASQKSLLHRSITSWQFCWRIKLWYSKRFSTWGATKIVISEPIQSTGVADTLFCRGSPLPKLVYTGRFLSKMILISTPHRLNGYHKLKSPVA